MRLDVVDLREFYINPLGRAVRQLLRERLQRIWSPSSAKISAETVLALGYATPLLRPWLGKIRSLIALMPLQQGVAYWPREGPNLAGLVDFHQLPLADEVIDRVVMMHALETANDPSSLLDEVWRVLKSQGRVLIIVPNRRGIWAYSDRTPFGTGQPFSARQLKQQLREHGFEVERSWRALHMPPSHSAWGQRLMLHWEKIGDWFFSGFGGLLIVEASKQLYAPILTKARASTRRLVLPMAMPNQPLPVGRNS